jgi:hypothetical protein
VIAVLSFACEPGLARRARVLARAVERRLARVTRARVVPLAAAREGEVSFLNRTEPFGPGEAVSIARDQGADFILDGVLAATAGPFLVEARALLFSAREGRITAEAQASLGPPDLLVAADRIARRIAPALGAPLPAGDEALPVADLEALELYIQAEEIAMRCYRSAEEAARARAERAALLALAARRDARIALEVAAHGGA